MVRVEKRLGVVLAAFAAALLVCWMLALPVLAQDGAEAEAGDAKAQAGDVNLQFVDCSQVINLAVQQGQYGDATAVADGIGNAAAAEIANDLDISVNQVNACLGTIGDDGGKGGDTNGDDTDGDDTNGDDTNGDDTNGDDTNGDDTNGDVASDDDVIDDTIVKKTLANTGGPSFTLPTAGMILTGAGLLMLGVLRRRL